MNKSSIFACVLLVGFLSGCGKDLPDDALTAKTVRPYAQQDVAYMKGLEISDFVRDNGWVDAQQPSRYIVRYKYDLELKQPFPVVLLESTKEFLKQYGDSKQTGALVAMQLGMGTNLWIDQQGDQFKVRRDTLFKQCAPCLQYVKQSGSSDEVTIRRNLFVLAWMGLERLGIPDSAKAGFKVPRTAWAAFTKTEKGWMAVDEVAGAGTLDNTASSGNQQSSATTPADNPAVTAAVNPATGLSMVGNTDSAGTPYGVEAAPVQTGPMVNPTTGLPMIQNTQMDVGGNTFGTGNMGGVPETGN